MRALIRHTIISAILMVMAIICLGSCEDIPQPGVDIVNNTDKTIGVSTWEWSNNSNDYYLKSSSKLIEPNGGSVHIWISDFDMAEANTKYRFVFTEYADVDWGNATSFVGYTKTVVYDYTDSELRAMNLLLVYDGTEQ